MEKIRKDKLEKLREKIKKYNEILQSKESLEQRTKKDFRNLKIKTFIAAMAWTSITTLASKGLGFGYPIITEKLKTYQGIETTIDDSGRFTEVPQGYNCPDFGGLMGVQTQDNYLYNHSEWAKTITDDYVKYIEKYYLDEISIDEVRNLLSQDSIDFDYILQQSPFTVNSDNKQQKSPVTIIEKDYTEEDLQQGPYIEAVFHDFDANDYIYADEPSYREEGASAWLLGITCFPILMGLLIGNSELDAYKKNFEEMVEKNREKYEEKTKKAQKRLEKLKK